MTTNWEVMKDTFPVTDVRQLTGNFLPMILKKAQQTGAGNGLCIIQTFEPIPLYSAMEDMGFERLTEKISATEYRSYFYRREKREITHKGGADMPFKPTAILNFKFIEDELASSVVNFWELIWEKEDAAIDLKTKLLLSMSNAVGASRFRQATREFIKAYSLGVTVREFDEIFSLFAWNQGIGHFASEIGPSPLFGVYRLVKRREMEGKERKMIMDEVMEKFGEKNRDVNTIFRNPGDQSDHS